MSSLYDEAREKTSQQVATTVRNLGGGLYDELAIKNRQPGQVTEEMRNRAVNEERQKMVGILNDELSAFEKMRITLGRGLSAPSRALGTVMPSLGSAPEDPMTSMGASDIEDKSTPAMLTGVVGEAAQFLPLGGLIAVLNRTLPRVAAGTALGALEGGTIVRGKGGDTNETVQGATMGGAMGGIIEAVTPMLGSLMVAVYRAVKGRPRGPLLTVEGTVTPDMQEALDATNTTLEGLAEEAFTKVNVPDVNLTQAARAARFKSEGIPYTEGDLTQDFRIQAREQRLAGSATDEAGEPYRQARLAQSEAFQAAANRFIDSLGLPTETGRAVKEALRGRKKLLQNQKNAFYRQAGEAAPEIQNMPLFVDSLVEAMPEARKARRINRLAPGPSAALNDLLVEFGIDQSDEAVEAFVKSGGEVTPLTLGNFEDFRAAINLIERSDPSNAVSTLTGPIKRALDQEASLIDEAVKMTGMDDQGVLDILKQARERVRTLKTEFSPQSITGRLIDMKRDGFTEVIEASKVGNELLRPGAPVEYLQRTIQSLKQAGKKGQQAIGHLRATTVLNALEASLKATGRKVDGTATVGGTAFAKYLKETVGDEKLKILFEGAEDQLARLLNFRQTALDMTATNAAIPKGSADVNADIARAFIGSGFFSKYLGPIGSMLKVVVKPALNTRATRRAITFTPTQQKVASEFAKQFPELASTLGIAAMISGPQDQNNE